VRRALKPCRNKSFSASLKPLSVLFMKRRSSGTKSSSIVTVVRMDVLMLGVTLP
jgi:hypothetical protein